MSVCVHVHGDLMDWALSNNITGLKMIYDGKKGLKGKSAAPAIPERSPIPVLRWPDVA